MRLIDADEVLKALDVFSDTEHGDKHFLNGIETTREVIKNIPTAFDEDKVLSQISVKASEASDKAWEDMEQYDYWDGVEDGLDCSYNIVKKGGIDG